MDSPARDFLGITTVSGNSIDLTVAIQRTSAIGRKRNSALHKPVSANERTADYLLVTDTPVPAFVRG